VLNNGVPQPPNPAFVGGVGTVLDQLARRNFPSENGGYFFSATVRNRAAQADNAVDQLTIRQSQLVNARDQKQAQVDVLNGVVAMRQARARYDAAVHNRILQKSLADAEQEKFRLGTSVPYNVIQAQRDLVAAQSTEIAALVAYSNAKVTLEQTTGTILDAYHISLSEAAAGKVARPSSLPATLPSTGQ
jgi:outer membrane protein TolC